MITENNTTAQKIAEKISMQIAEGMLLPGERLIETELTKIFNVSRSPIREALFILESQGLVEKIPRRGVIVKKILIKEILDLYDVVYHITELALYKGIELVTEDQIRELNEIIRDMHTTVEKREVKKCHLYVESLHLKLIQLSDNSVLEDVYKKLNMRWTTFRYLTLSHPISLKKSADEYGRIVEYIEKRKYEIIPEILNIKKHRGISILKSIMTE